MPTVCRFASCHLSRRPVAYNILTVSPREYVPEGHILITRWCFLTTRDHLYRPCQVRQPCAQPSVRYRPLTRWLSRDWCSLGFGSCRFQITAKKKRFPWFSSVPHTNAGLVPRVKQRSVPSIVGVFNPQPSRLWYIICMYNIPLAARPKAWVCGRSLAEIVGSNLTGDIDVCLLWVFCVVR